MMTPEVAHETAKLIASYYPSRLAAETVRAWSVSLRKFERCDAEAGIVRMAETERHPDLAVLLDCIEAAKADRLRREERERGLALPALPAPSREAHAAVDARTKEAQRQAREAFAAFMRRSPPTTRKARERSTVAATPFTQTQAQAEARRAELAAMAERLQREAEADTKPTNDEEETR